MARPRSRRFSPARSFRLRLFQRGKLGHEEARVSQIAVGLVSNIGEDHLADLDDRSFRRVRGRILDTNCEVIGFGEALRDSGLTRPLLSSCRRNRSRVIPCKTRWHRATEGAASRHIEE